MIWDLHCHLSGVDGRTPAERIAQMIEIGDRMGIERFCFYMGQPTLIDPTPDQLRRQNDEVLEALQHWHHRAFGFVYLKGGTLLNVRRHYDRWRRNRLRKKFDVYYNDRKRDDDNPRWRTRHPNRSPPRRPSSSATSSLRRSTSSRSTGDAWSRRATASSPALAGRNRSASRRP